MAISLPASNRVKESVGIATLRLLSLASAMAVVVILGFLLYFSLPLLQDGSWQQLWSWQWNPERGQWGILAPVVGSLLSATLATLIAFPISLGVCCFIVAIGPCFLRMFLRRVIYLMTGVPTVVYALISVTLLVPLVRDFSGNSGFCWLTTSLTLSLLIMPTIVLVMLVSIEAIWQRESVTVEALGLTRAQGLLSVVLPQSLLALATSAMLGWARALGDTMVALMVSGNAPHVPKSVFDTLRTLTAHIALVVTGDSQQLAYRAVFLCGLLLFLIIAFVSHFVQRMRSAL